MSEKLIFYAPVLVALAAAIPLLILYAIGIRHEWRQNRQDELDKSEAQGKDATPDRREADSEGAAHGHGA